MLKNHARNYRKIASTSIVLVMLLLFFSGCQQSSGETYRTGTNGLIIEFTKSNPKSIYEGEEFGTALIVTNIGSYNITKDNPAILKTCIDDYRLKFLDSENNCNEESIDLIGKGRNYPKGDEEFYQHNFESLRLTHLRESSKTNINYNLCYPYNTELTIVTCIDTKVANRDESAVACSSETYSSGTGQGAPIAVTKIVPEILLQSEYVRPQFKIYIENKGNGYVTDRSTCDNTDINDRNSSGRVNIYAWLSDRILECGPDNSQSLRLVDGESFIRCYLPNNDNGYLRTSKNYLTPLTVRIEYTYTTITEQEIEIKRDDTLEQVVTNECNIYQVRNSEGECVDKCTYCASNPTDVTVCKDNWPTTDFTFGENFSCSCLLAQCNTKEPKGNCIKGYCPGNLYCCNTIKCDNYQVEYNGVCMDKCAYCREHGDDTTICPSTFNFENFECQSINKTECNSQLQNKTCVLGYCGGANIDKYCTSQNS
ncbi:MAG: hypothetical protein ACP5N1_01500 [Candidatus Woesearchaeota archaeon]